MVVLRCSVHEFGRGRILDQNRGELTWLGSMQLLGIARSAVRGVDLVRHAAPTSFESIRKMAPVSPMRLDLRSLSPDQIARIPPAEYRLMVANYEAFRHPGSVRWKLSLGRAHHL
jgi:hypothetical protein